MTKFVKTSIVIAARHPVNLALGLAPAVAFLVIGAALLLS